MTALDYILAGLERNLELERELGGNGFEVDRTLLTSVVRKTAADRDEKTVAVRCLKPEAAEARTPVAVEPPVSAIKPSIPVAERTSAVEELVFLHDGALSTAAMEVMERICLAAKGKGCESRLVVAEPVPPARAYILLGKAAVARFAPSLAGSRREAVGISFSPEEFVRFADSLAVKQKKLILWNEILKKVQLIKSMRG